MTLSTVILAAGQGKRMRSHLPKILHSLAGKPLLEHVVATAQIVSTQKPLVIFGHQGEKVRETLAHLNVEWVKQQEQLGTAHALQQALPAIDEKNRVLVLYGDVPLISPDTLKNFIAQTPSDALGIITAKLPDPSGLGRVIRDKNNKIISVVEEKDANSDQLNQQEINTGIYLFPANHLKNWLSKINNNNQQKEYYLTDVIPLALAEKIAIQDFQPAVNEEIFGINDRVQLAALERFYQKTLAEKIMRQGVTLMDPKRFDIRGNVTIGQDVVIDVNVILEGQVVIGNHCIIGPNTVLRNVILGDRVEIKANSVIEGANIANECVVGPFARVRPGTILSANSHIGNFVEIKNSEIGAGSKVNHLSYIGDSVVGTHVNVGAGTITCNYDGANKHKTIIGNHAFIGSNTSLVAPVIIGEGAYIGTHSTITRDAPPNQLTVCRAREQRSIPNWQKPKKKEKD
jgi:bifunctional UDP-N-acetylglucosamine pyrophosphorylase/glucosamine-1-phosphate N-acetyltransferase